MRKTLPVRYLLSMMLVILSLTTASFLACKSPESVVDSKPVDETVPTETHAKKPTIMIVPSDAYCMRNGYTTEWIDENGNVNEVPDLANVFKNGNADDLRLVISELSRIMAERGFPLKDLEQKTGLSN